MRIYTMTVTRAQINRFIELKQRLGGDPSMAIGGNMDAVTIGSEAEADMISGQFGNIYVGILPDGSAHS